MCNRCFRFIFRLKPMYLCLHIIRPRSRARCQHTSGANIVLSPVLSVFALLTAAVMIPIRQDKRVSMGLNGDLYFSNVMAQDARNDYSCNARFLFTHTIQQKNPFTLKVLSSKWTTRPYSKPRQTMLADKRSLGSGGILEPPKTPPPKALHGQREQSIFNTLDRSIIDKK